MRGKRPARVISIVSLALVGACGGDTGGRLPESVVPADARRPTADAAAPETADAGPRPPAPDGAVPPAADAGTPGTPDAGATPAPDAAAPAPTPDAAPATPDAAPAPAAACTSTPRLARGQPRPDCGEPHCPEFTYYSLTSDGEHLYYIRYEGDRFRSETPSTILALPLDDLADAPVRVVTTIPYAARQLQEDGPDLFWRGWEASKMAGGVFAVAKDGSGLRAVFSNGIGWAEDYLVDGPSVYVQSHGTAPLVRVARSGDGAPQPVSEPTDGLALSGDATDLYWISSSYEIRRVAKSGGTSELVADAREQSVRSIVADGDRFLLGGAGIFAVSKDGAITLLGSLGGRMATPYRSGAFVYAHGFDQYIDDDEQYLYRLPAAGGTPVELVRQGRGVPHDGLVFHDGCIYYAFWDALWTVAQ
jgi:hypothetical protein